MVERNRGALPNATHRREQCYVDAEQRKPKWFQNMKGEVFTSTALDVISGSLTGPTCTKP